jgi:chromosome segregation ATPase
VTERDRLKKELARAQKHAHGLEKAVLAYRRDLEAAGDNVRALQRERTLLLNQMGLLESRLAEVSGIARQASSRLTKLQAQSQQQQLQLAAAAAREQEATQGPAAGLAATTSAPRPQSGGRTSTRRGGGGTGNGEGEREEE